MIGMEIQGTEKIPAIFFQNAYLFFICVYVCEPSWVYAHHMFVSPQRPEKDLGSMHLELQMLVSMGPL